MGVDPEDQRLVDSIKESLLEQLGEPIVDDLNPHPLLPILYMDAQTPHDHQIARLLREGSVPVMVITSLGEVESELSKRGLSDQEIQEKLTGLTHPMRSDAELPGLAEVLRAMPAIVPKPEPRESRRPALPKNRKRDRWT